jgi:predicted nucleotidyltransferase
MDILDEDLLKFWKCLNDNMVQYLMVGGLSVNFNGYNRVTDDLDIWLKDTHENRKNLRKTFRDLEYGDFLSFETTQFIPGWSQFYVGPGIILDIMTEMKGLEQYSFDECFENASVASIDGIKVPFLHVNHLLENKKAVGRPKDLEDVRELEKIIEERKKMGLD